MTQPISPSESSGREQQRDVAYNRLRQLLILSQLTPGERLREPEWAGRLGVNRTALREAFARLEAEGMLDRGPATGYFVPQFTPEEISEIIRIRLALEVFAIRELCALPGDLAERFLPMREASDAFALMLRQKYILGTYETDRRFHEELIRATGMNRLEQVYRRAPLPMFSAKLHLLDDWHITEQRSLEEHRALIAALEARDVEKSIGILTRHLTHPLPTRP